MAGIREASAFVDRDWKEAFRAAKNEGSSFFIDAAFSFLGEQETEQTAHWHLSMGRVQISTFFCVFYIERLPSQINLPRWI